MDIYEENLLIIVSERDGKSSTIPDFWYSYIKLIEDGHITKNRRFSVRIYR